MRAVGEPFESRSRAVGDPFEPFEPFETHGSDFERSWVWRTFPRRRAGPPSFLIIRLVGLEDSHIASFGS